MDVRKLDLRRAGLALVLMGLFASAACDEGLLELPPEEELTADVMEFDAGNEPDTDTDLRLDVPGA